MRSDEDDDEDEEDAGVEKSGRALALKITEASLAVDNSGADDEEGGSGGNRDAYARPLPTLSLPKLLPLPLLLLLPLATRDLTLPLCRFVADVSMCVDDGGGGGSARSGTHIIGTRMSRLSSCVSASGDKSVPCASGRS